MNFREHSEEMSDLLSAKNGTNRIKKVSEDNNTRITEVWITGLQHEPGSQIILFTSILLLYLMILLGNVLVILLVASTEHLHAPMYVFLCSLSLSEIIFTTNLIPMFLNIILNDGSTMALSYCLAQFYICASVAATESFLLAVMSYDRYVAICKPLHYTLTMNLTFCKQLIICSWMSGFTNMLITLIMVCQLHFCGPKTIDHFFCDFAPLVRLSCSDTFAVQTETFVMSTVVTIFPFGFIIGTYVCIINTIKKIHSSTGRQKTFSTCSTHLAVVSTFYGTLITVYVVPDQGLSSSINKILCLIYTVITPLFNPIIYSLRNREIRAGFKNIFKRYITIICKVKK
ncbi:olfactory receptor 6C3-like [Pelodytes ibericus]